MKSLKQEISETQKQIRIASQAGHPTSTIDQMYLQLKSLRTQLHDKTKQHQDQPDGFAAIQRRGGTQGDCNAGRSAPQRPSAGVELADGVIEATLWPGRAPAATRLATPRPMASIALCGSCCPFQGKTCPRFSLVKATLLVQIVISGFGSC